MSAFCDLLKILGDREEATEDPLTAADIRAEQLEAMKENWEDEDEEKLRNRIVELRRLYDWPALVAAINVCPGGVSNRDAGVESNEAQNEFKVLDLFNLLDMHEQSGHGFQDRQGTFLPPQRVIGARGALVLLIQTLASHRGVGVGSDRSALFVSQRVGFCGPPSETDVRLSPHPALPVFVPMNGGS